MKFKFLAFSADGNEPIGTNSSEVAQAMAAREDSWVVDVEDGTLIDSNGEPEASLEEADPGEYLDSTDDDSDD